MMKTITGGIIILAALALSVTPSAAAQRGENDFAGPGDDFGKPLPRKASIASDSIENRSALSDSSVLKKAKHDPAEKSITPDDRRKRTLALFGKNPVRFNSTVRRAKDIAPVRRVVVASGNARPRTGRGGFALKITVTVLCLSLVGLMAALLLHRRKKPGAKPITIGFQGQPIDLTKHMKSLDSFEQQIKRNIERSKRGTR